MIGWIRRKLFPEPRLLVWDPAWQPDDDGEFSLSFVQAYFFMEVAVADLDAWVKRWRMSYDPRPLQACLGFTNMEFGRWQFDGHAAESIIRARCPRGVLWEEL